MLGSKSLEKEIHKIASNWINRESNKTSLITITSCTLSNDQKYCTMGVSVLPENQERAVLDFLTRNKDTVRGELKKRGKLHTLPYIIFTLDEGEKNRQKVFDILGDSQE